MHKSVESGKRIVPSNLLFREVNPPQRKSQARRPTGMFIIDPDFSIPGLGSRDRNTDLTKNLGIFNPKNDI